MNRNNAVLIILSLFMICLFISSVSAVDTNSTYFLNHNVDDNEILTDSMSSTGDISSFKELENSNMANNNLKANNDNTILSQNRTVNGNTFRAIQETINSANSGDTIILDGKYTNNNGQININKANLIIIGTNNCILDAQGKTRIFEVKSDNITIKNIKFINGNTDDNYGGGAIYWCDGINGIVSNCTFTNNAATSTANNGGAISWRCGNGTINNCTFTSNTAPYGGAIDWRGSNGTISNCTFTGNKAKYSSGAIDWRGSNGTISNCTFTGNTATGNLYSNGGGAIYLHGKNCIIVNSSFNSNKAIRGGAIYCNSLTNSGVLVNCTFTANTATGSYQYGGGAIYWSGDNGTVGNCTFTGNNAARGGAIYWSGDNGTVSNCTFTNNNIGLLPDDGVLYWIGSNGHVGNCTFTGNKAKRGGAIFWDILASNGVVVNCTFTSNTAAGSTSYDGGAIKWIGSKGTVSDCIFTNNTADFGGAIDWGGEDGVVSNCTFTGNRNTAGYGGAIEWIGNNGHVNNCTFTNNTSTGSNYYNSSGGAVYWHGKYGVVSNCTFTNNTSTGSVYSNRGGAIYWYKGVNGIIVNCTFNNNTSDYGGAIYWYGNNGRASNCSFTGNNANQYGSAINWFGSAGNLIGCNFINNDDTNQVYWENDKTGLIEGCTFTNNTHSVINNGATFKRNEISLIYSNSSFNYKSPLNNSVKLFNTLEKFPIHSTITFNFNKGNNTKNFDVKIIDNSAFICNELTNFEVGTWFVTAICNGDDNYNPCETKFTVTINPISSSLNLSVNNTIFRHETTIKAKILDINKSIIDEGSVAFYDNNKLINIVNVVDGIANLVYTPTTSGEHTITASYTSNNYLSSNNSLKLFVDTISLNINVNNSIVGFNNTVIVNINGLYSIINDGTVSFYEDNDKIGNATVVNGVAKLNYTSLNAGNHTIKAVYTESDKFDSVENSTSFIVDKSDTNLIIDEVNGSVGKEIIFTAHINSSNKLTINEGIVNFYDGEKNIGTTNVINGVANLVYTPSTAGEHTIIASYTSNNYLNSNSSYNFNVKKTNTTIIFNNIDKIYYSTSVTFIVNVLSNGINVNEGIVKFYINNVEIAHETLNNGITFNYTPPNAGSFIIIAVFEETDNFFASSASYSFVVNELPVLISSSDVTTVYNNGNYLSITLKDLFGNALTGVKINVNLNGVKTLTTDKNGQAKITTNGLTPKIYSVEITFDGNKKYLDATKNVKVTVKKANPKLTAQAKTFKKSVKTKKYAITLKTNQNKVMKNTKITLKVNGKTYSAKTNTKGIATFKITKLNKKGKFKATIKYAGNHYFNAKSVIGKITVK